MLMVGFSSGVFGVLAARAKWLSETCLGAPPPPAL